MAALLSAFRCFWLLMIAITLYGYRRYLRPAASTETAGHAGDRADPAAVIVTDEPEQKIAWSS